MSGSAHTVHGRADNILQEYPPISLRDARCDVAKSVVAVTLPQTSGVARNGRASPVGQFSSATTSGAPKAESSLTTAKGSLFSSYTPIRVARGIFKSRQEDGGSFYGCWQRYGGMVRAETEGVQQIGRSQSRDSHMSEFRITCREDPPTSHKPGETPLCSVSRLAFCVCELTSAGSLSLLQGGTSLLLSSASAATIVKIAFLACKQVTQSVSVCDDIWGPHFRASDFVGHFMCRRAIQRSVAAGDARIKLLWTSHKLACSKAKGEAMCAPRKPGLLFRTWYKVINNICRAGC